MKNRVLLVLLLSFAVSLAASAQKITMNLQQVKLEKVFSLITKQTGLTVAYSRTIVNPERIVSVQAKDKDLSKVLDDLFAGTNVAYEIGEKKIYLKAKEAPLASQGSQKTKKITGTVTDIKGEPIIGASVLVKGAGTGTVTDVDGNFTLDASADALLAVSYIGYKTQEVKVGNKNSYSIQLQDDTEVLDEVVVVGYGVQKKSSLTGAVASISSQEISKQVSSNVASSLQGRTPGVDIVQQAGVAGADVNIVIRGAASFGATEPLYVIDGAFSNAGLSSLNPNDIESIEVLKDGAAAAIYGSRAANGVVLITTKKGKSGKPVIQIDGSFAFQKTTNIPEFLNASEWREFANMVADNSGLPHAPENDNPTNPNLNTDWSKEWIQFAPVWNLNASIAGGGDNSTFSTSLGYLDQTGMTIYSDYKRYNFRLNTSYKKGRFSFSETLGLTHKDKTPTTAFNIALPTLPIS